MGEQIAEQVIAFADIQSEPLAELFAILTGDEAGVSRVFSRLSIKTSTRSMPIPRYIPSSAVWIIRLISAFSRVKGQLTQHAQLQRLAGF